MAQSRHPTPSRQYPLSGTKRTCRYVVEPARMIILRWYSCWYRETLPLKKTNISNSCLITAAPPLGTIPLALDAGVGGLTDGIRCVIAFIEHGFCVDQIRGVEAFRETGIDTGHAFPRLRAGAAGGSASASTP